jgi:hypothetical protein
VGAFWEVAQGSPPAPIIAPAAARRGEGAASFAGIMTSIGAGGRKPHFRHEASRVHHTARRRGSGVAACGAGAAVGDATARNGLTCLQTVCACSTARCVRNRDGG